MYQTLNCVHLTQKVLFGLKQVMYAYWMKVTGLATLPLQKKIPIHNPLLMDKPEQEPIKMKKDALIRKNHNQFLSNGE